VREIYMLRSTRRGLETWHGRDGVTLADERARQRGTQTSTYTGAQVLDPTLERAEVKFLRATRQERYFRRSGSTDEKIFRMCLRAPCRSDHEAQTRSCLQCRAIRAVGGRAIRAPNAHPSAGRSRWRLCGKRLPVRGGLPSCAPEVIRRTSYLSSLFRKRISAAL
jgi:hypothetical protein